MHAARIGVSLKGCTAYVTHCPCAGYARALVQAGITQVVFVPEMTSRLEQYYRIVVSMFGGGRADDPNRKGRTMTDRFGKFESQSNLNVNPESQQTLESNQKLPRDPPRDPTCSIEVGLTA